MNSYQSAIFYTLLFFGVCVLYQVMILVFIRTKRIKIIEKELKKHIDKDKAIEGSKTIFGFILMWNILYALMLLQAIFFFSSSSDSLFFAVAAGNFIMVMIGTLCGISFSTPLWRYMT